MIADMPATIHRTRRLGRARLMTGKERRRINPNKGLVKILERNLDMLVSRFLYPHLSRVWNPYSWLLERRFVLTENVGLTGRLATNARSAAGAAALRYPYGYI